MKTSAFAVLSIAVSLLTLAALGAEYFAGQVASADAGSVPTFQ